jgi:hypothetical protein
MDGTDNLRRVLWQATREDIATGMESWRTYERLTREIACKHRFASHIGAAVFSALSPNNDYHGNLRDTDTLLGAVRLGKSMDDFGVSTYGNNKRKAWAIAHGAEPLDLLLFPKTRNFYLNIKDPLNPMPVTCDGHVYNAWRGRRIPLKGAAAKFKPSEYEEIAQAIRDLGAEYGMIPNQVQGVIWHTWRRLHRIKYTNQLEFWDCDSLSAGLGYSH